MNKKPKSLFNIGVEFYVLNDLANSISYDPETGEVIDESEQIKALFDEIKGELSDKLDNTTYVIKEIKGNIDTLDTEIKRLTAKKRVLQNKSDMLKQLMLGALKASGENKIQTTLHTFAIRKSTSVECNEEIVDRKYLKVEYKADKKKISDVLKNGGTIEGAQLVEKQNLNIR